MHYLLILMKVNKLIAWMLWVFVRPSSLRCVFNNVLLKVMKRSHFFLHRSWQEAENSVANRSGEV